MGFLIYAVTTFFFKHTDRALQKYRRHNTLTAHMRPTGLERIWCLVHAEEFVAYLRYLCSYNEHSHNSCPRFKLKSTTRKAIMKIQRSPFQSPTFQSIAVRNCKRYKNQICGMRKRNSNLVPYLEVAASAVVWCYSHEKQNKTPQQRAEFLVWR